MSQSLYSFQAEIEGKTRYVKAYGDTEDQAKTEALWIFKRETGVPITEINNVQRVCYTVDDKSNLVTHYDDEENEIDNSCREEM